MTTPNEVTYIAPESLSRFTGVDDLTIIVTETGRTYAVVGSQWSCYIDPITGKYRTHAQQFINWWNSLNLRKRCATEKA
jgi:hypothetical protein